jgi:hypothetical protein
VNHAAGRVPQPAIIIDVGLVDSKASRIGRVAASIAWSLVRATSSSAVAAFPATVWVTIAHKQERLGTQEVIESEPLAPSAASPRVADV